MHISERCDTPGTLWRRLGSLWKCDCGQLWVLRINYYGYEHFKEWQKDG